MQQQQQQNNEKFPGRYFKQDLYSQVWDNFFKKIPA